MTDGIATAAALVVALGWLFWSEGWRGAVDVLLVVIPLAASILLAAYWGSVGQCSPWRMLVSLALAALAMAALTRNTRRID